MPANSLGSSLLVLVLVVIEPRAGQAERLDDDDEECDEDDDEGDRGETRATRAAPRAWGAGLA